MTSIWPANQAQRTACRDAVVFAVDRALLRLLLLLLLPVRQLGGSSLLSLGLRGTGSRSHQRLPLSSRVAALAAFLGLCGDAASVATLR